MAKWGEGDARWIVEEREDGTNADNWHWTEKNATRWSEQKIKDLMKDLSMMDASGGASVTEVTSVAGDCIANCRKGKLIFFYELVVKMKWKGKTKDGDVVNGDITIPNISEEQDDMDEVDVNVSMSTSESPETRKVKELVRTKGRDLIRVQLTKWNTELKEEYSVNLVKPTKKGSAGPSTPSASPAAKPATKPAASPAAAPTPAANVAAAFKSITLTDEFRCPPDALFRALVTEDQIRAYTQSDCKIDPKVGGEFSMFGGNVQGVFKELEPGKKIVQAWRFKHWAASHFSDVTLEISDLGDKSKLTLTQSGIPESDLESTKAGWRSHQWERMKSILGFGSSINFGL